MRTLLYLTLLLLAACTSSARRASTPTNDEISLRGSFRSVRGVMDPLSCYCYNGGYLTTADGEQYALCFADDEELDSCEDLRVTATETTKSIDPEPNSPCSAGERTLYTVKTLTCEE